VTRGLIGAFAVVLLVVVACRNDKEDACTVDTDCPQGSFCREGFCAAIGASDAGVDAQVLGVACASPGASCTLDTDCCSPPCSNSRCAGTGTSGRSGGSAGTSGASGTSGTSGTSTSGGGCPDLYTLCSGDFECCPGLSCNNGVCR
jgi:hypothetical protein